MTTWVQLSSGRGPEECGWVVAQLLAVFRKEANEVGISVEVVESTPGSSPGTFRSVLLGLDGDNADMVAKEWHGTVQWIGQSPFRPKHKRKNWFVSIQVFKPPSAIQFDMSTVRFERSRASGPGGQHVNCTETAVRAVHLPTGIAARASNERSQHFNRQLALARLVAAIAAKNEDDRATQRNSRWGQHSDLERGNATRVYEGQRFDRVR